MLAKYDVAGSIPAIRSMSNTYGYKIQRGRRILCAKSGKIHYEQDEIATFEFADYSWHCNACGGTHCSNCFYESDGETITVWDCGRFG